jgi:hypothetical protein
VCATVATECVCTGAVLQAEFVCTEALLEDEKDLPAHVKQLFEQCRYAEVEPLAQQLSQMQVSHCGPILTALIVAPSLLRHNRSLSAHDT